MVATEPVVHVVVPVRVISEANEREHWGAKQRRKVGQQTATTLVLRALVSGRTRTALAGGRPVHVVLTRLVGKRGRMMDDDNLKGSMKHVRDAVAKWLGRDDGPTSGVTWTVTQEKAENGEHAVRITISEG